MGKLIAKGLNGLLTKPPKRWPDGGGLFFKTLGKGRAYWTYRFTLKGRETEMSLGAYPEMSLDEARVAHLRLCADVAEGKDPVGERRKDHGKAPVLTPSGAPTFGHCADQHIGLNEGGWKNVKHHQQWVMTLREYAAPLRSMPVDKVTTADVLAVLTPIWNDKPETASRLRGRIEAVIASAQVDGWIPRTGRTPRGGRTGSTANCPNRRSSAHAVTTRPCPTINCQPLWRGSRRSTALRRGRCNSPS